MEKTVTTKSISIDDFLIRIHLTGKFFNSSLNVNEGDLQFSYDDDNETSFLTWEIKKINFDKDLPYMKGNLSFEGDFEKESNVLTMSGRIPNYSATKSSITKVNIIKDEHKISPFKGGLLTTNIKNLEIIF